MCIKMMERTVFGVFLLLLSLLPVSYARPLPTVEPAMLANSSYNTPSSILTFNAPALRQRSNHSAVFVYKGKEVSDDGDQYNIQVVTNPYSNELQSVAFQLGKNITVETKIFEKNGETWLSSVNSLSNQEIQMPLSVMKALLQSSHTGERRKRFRRSVYQNETDSHNISDSVSSYADYYTKDAVHQFVAIGAILFITTTLFSLVAVYRYGKRKASMPVTIKLLHTIPNLPKIEKIPEGIKGKFFSVLSKLISIYEYVPEPLGASGTVLPPPLDSACSVTRELSNHVINSRIEYAKKMYGTAEYLSEGTKKELYNIPSQLMYNIMSEAAKKLKESLSIKELAATAINTLNAFMNKCEKGYSFSRSNTPVPIESPFPVRRTTLN